MAHFRFKSSLRRSANPQFAFLSLRPTIGLARLLAEKRGKEDAFQRLDCFIYAALIYDNLATQYRSLQNRTGSQLQSWLALAGIPAIADLYESSQSFIYHGKRLGALVLKLPIASLDPARSTSRAPRGCQTGDYPIGNLSCEDFIEVAYMVRCNFLHGSYDVADDATADILLKVGSRFVSLVWRIASQSTW